MLEFQYPAHLMEQLRQIPLAPYLAVLMRIARVNEISVAERDVAVPLARALGASEATTIEALQLADDDARPLASLAASVPRTLSACLYRDACRMAWADGSVDTPENALLSQLAAVLELDDERSLQIRDLVGQIARAQRGLLRLLEQP